MTCCSILVTRSWSGRSRPAPGLPRGVEVSNGALPVASSGGTLPGQTYLRQVVGGLVAPLEQEQGGVVAGRAASLSHERVGEPAHGLLDRTAGLLGALELVGEAVLAEPVDTGHAFLDDAVGEEQHSV